MKAYAARAATRPTPSRGGMSHRISLVRRLLILPGLDEVTEAAHRADADARRLELRAKARHVHFHRVGRKLLLPGCDGRDDAVLAYDGVHVREEVFEDRVLALRQVEGTVAERGALALEVDRERTV